MSDSQTRLARVLGMMGSEHDGEVLNAARLAEKIRREMNKSWSSLISGQSDTTSSDWMIRALRAETRAVTLERHSRELETRVQRLEGEIAAMRTGRSQRPARNATTDFDLSPEVEARLVEDLLARTRPANWIHVRTGWPRPMQLRKRLPAIAAKHGLRFESPFRGYYRFHRN